MTAVRRRTILSIFTAGVSSLGLTPFATTATAQTVADAQVPASATAQVADTVDEADNGEVIVTGSRIDRAGFDAPTPTLRLGAEELSIGGRVNVGAALNDLPQFRATSSPQTSGTNTAAGSAPVDLRGLGINRTLVLLDGHRFSSDNDLNTVPQVLIRSVDVVTGGASAAWGSGAVAGVVNITLDDRLKGVRLGAQAGVSSFGDAAEERFEAAAGLSFSDDRGQLVVGGEYLNNDGVIPKVSRPRVGRWATVPDGNGRFILAPDVGFSNAALGGIILSGVLRGQVFNPDGTLRTFDGGIIRGTNSIGGEGPSNDDLSPLVTPQQRYNGLARLSYDISDKVRGSVELRHSRMYNNYVWFGDHNRGNLTIRSDNAFLSDTIRRQLATAGQTSFTFGRFNSERFPTIDFERKTTQGTIAFDGKFGSDRYRWSAYYSHGEFQNYVDTPGFLLAAPFRNAVDSVISPVTGRPICRIALTDPATNCVPINLFGQGAPSQAALDYVTGTPMQRATTTLDVAGYSLRGEPFALPAGAVSFAMGVEGRKERVRQTVGAQDAQRAFLTFSFSPLAGSFTVKEAFGEVLVPLVYNTPLLRQLDVNAAARISDYNTTGSIWSYKLGATNAFGGGVRGRLTYSRDIRSANLAELFTQTTTGFNTLTDPQTRQSLLVLNNGGGNPNLQPEVANTFTAGLVVSPTFVPRLNLSIDYYDIDIDNVITTIAPQDLVTRCFNGNAALCERIDRAPDGTLIRTRSTFVNLANYKTSGVDAEFSYTLPLGGTDERRLQFRALATWVDNLSTNDGVSRIDYVRSLGNAFGLGVPRWRANLSAGYRDDTLSGLVRVRYLSAGKFNVTQDIVNGDIPAYTYVDLQLQAQIAQSGRGQLEVYANATNLFDKQPPAASLFSPFYDVIGRYVTVGARVRF